MTIADSSETSRSEYIKVGIFTSRKDMETFVTRLKAESGISYTVTIYPADATDVNVPPDHSWSGGKSYTVVAQGTVVRG
jgi:hypothetical protein